MFDRRPFAFARRVDALRPSGWMPHVAQKTGADVGCLLNWLGEEAFASGGREAHAIARARTTGASLAPLVHIRAVATPFAPSMVTLDFVRDLPDPGAAAVVGSSRPPEKIRGQTHDYRLGIIVVCPLDF
jgi:hypothetical protein